MQRLHLMLVLLILPTIVSVGVLLSVHRKNAAIDWRDSQGVVLLEQERRGGLEGGNESDVVVASDSRFAKEWQRLASTVRDNFDEDANQLDKKEDKKTKVLLTLPDDVDASLIVYNRVPKCGSRSVLWVVRKNARNLGFKYKHSMEFWKFRMVEKDQVQTIHEITSLPRPAFFDMHVHFLNFTKFGERRPIYFNIIRDPINRLVSSYYFNRFGDSINKFMVSKFRGTDEERHQTFDQCVLLNKTECQVKRAFHIVPFFCGQDPRCREPSQWALREAIRHMENEYTFVGILEELDASMKILEQILPQYFKNASEHLEYLNTGRARESMQALKKSEAPPSKKVLGIMKERMAIEYEFYDVVRARFNAIKEQLGIS